MMGEDDVQTLIRVGAARDLDTWLGRNNVGVLLDKTGRPVRFGLANDSPAVNKAIKSGDLLGILGQTGLFLSVEAKHEGWTYRGTPHEVAQLNWQSHVIRRGGIALFATSWEQAQHEIARQYADIKARSR